MKKIILDENMPRRLGNLITGHSVTTVQKAGWAGIGNGELLTLLDGKFDVFLTSDKNLRYQQNLRGRKIAIVEVSFNAILLLTPLVPKIREAIDGAKENDYLEITPLTNWTSRVVFGVRRGLCGG